MNRVTMLKAGSQAPEFSLPNQDGREVALADLITHGSAILFFYPENFTPICTREACLFRDAWSDLAAAGIAVAGISPNLSESHAQFRARYDLGYTLLADPDKRVIKSFGVNGPFGIGVRRATFLIDNERVVQLAARANFRLTPHSKLLKSALSRALDDARGNR